MSIVNDFKESGYAYLLSHWADSFPIFGCTIGTKNDMFGFRDIELP